jgi:hypothetical protein
MRPNVSPLCLSAVCAERDVTERSAQRGLSRSPSTPQSPPSTAPEADNPFLRSSRALGPARLDTEPGPCRPLPSEDGPLASSATAGYSGGFLPGKLFPYSASHYLGGFSSDTDDILLPLSVGQLCALRWAIGAPMLCRTRWINGVKRTHYLRPGSFSFDLATAAQLLCMRLQAGRYPHLQAEIMTLQECLLSCKISGQLPKKSIRKPNLASLLSLRNGESLFSPRQRNKAVQGCGWSRCWPDDGSPCSVYYANGLHTGCMGVHDAAPGLPT